MNIYGVPASHQERAYNELTVPGSFATSVNTRKTKMDKDLRDAAHSVAAAVWPSPMTISTDSNQYVQQMAANTYPGMNGLPGFEVLPNGVDLRRFVADPAAAAATRRELDLEGRRVVLFAGRVGIEKGGRRLAAAIQRAAERVPAICLLVLSRSDDRLGAFPSGILDPARLRFGGWREGASLAAAYAAADLVAVPSLCYESGSLVALESMAAGRPVIATRFGGPGEYVLNKVTGLLIDPEDADSLALAIERLLLDPALRERLGRAGRKRAEEGFSLAHVVARTIEMYERAIALPRGPSPA